MNKTIKAVLAKLNISEEKYQEALNLQYNPPKAHENSGEAFYFEEEDILPDGGSFEEVIEKLKSNIDDKVTSKGYKFCDISYLDLAPDCDDEVKIQVKRVVSQQDKDDYKQELDNYEKARNIRLSVNCEKQKSIYEEFKEEDRKDQIREQIKVLQKQLGE